MKIESYKQGTPCWAELSTNDASYAKQFYSPLFRWDYEDHPTVTGQVYSLAMIDDSAVAAINRFQNEQWWFWAKPQWHLYLAVEDIDATANQVSELGGSLLGQVFNLVEAARGLSAAHHAGGTICFWEARSHRGAEIGNHHGSMTWAEVTTNNPSDASRFFTELLGLGIEEDATPTLGGEQKYVLRTTKQVAGIVERTRRSGEPAEQPDWTVYFGVDDLDAVVSTATELGGSVIQGPMATMHLGRVAKLKDPKGAVFGVQELRSN